MNCNEICQGLENLECLIEENGLYKKRETMYQIAIIFLVIALMVMGIYAIYDRCLDSEFDIETTEVEVIQDGLGCNSYIHGVGDIINGTKNKNKNY